MSRYTDLRTIKQLAQENPAFTEASLRWLVFNARQNGLDTAIVRIGRRVLIDAHKLDVWLEVRRESGS
jgi:hypothetical protein